MKTGPSLVTLATGVIPSSCYHLATHHHWCLIKIIPAKNCVFWLHYKFIEPEHFLQPQMNLVNAMKPKHFPDIFCLFCCWLENYEREKWKKYCIRKTMHYHSNDYKCVGRGHDSLWRRRSRGGNTGRTVCTQSSWLHPLCQSCHNSCIDPATTTTLSPRDLLISDPTLTHTKLSTHTHTHTKLSIHTYIAHSHTYKHTHTA